MRIVVEMEIGKPDLDKAGTFCSFPNMEELNLFDDEPREKLLRYGVGKLTDKELVMLLIQSGTKGRHIEEIADDVLEILDKKREPSVSELMGIAGMGLSKASVVVSAVELGRRRPLTRRRGIRCPEDIFTEVRHYSSRSQEHLIVIALNGAHEVLSVEVSTIGLVNMTIVHPREVFSNPIALRATAIAIAHNHPSGCIDPSDEDVAITKRIKNAGDILGIKLIDHLVFTDEKYYSFLEHELI